jgi:hypothetical protein
MGKVLETTEIGFEMSQNWEEGGQIELSWPVVALGTVVKLFSPRSLRGRRGERLEHLHSAREKVELLARMIS